MWTLLALVLLFGLGVFAWDRYEPRFRSKLRRWSWWT